MAVDLLADASKHRKKRKRVPKKSHNNFSTQCIECHTTAIHSMKN
jgi:hypothetical protein